MEAGLGLNTSKRRRTSWRNADLANASAEKNKNYPFTVKNVEGWKNGTDVPEAHFETLLAVLTDAEPSGAREPWQNALRKSRDVDATRSRDSRRKAYRLFMDGAAQLGTDRPGMASVPSASLLFSHGPQSNGVNLPLLTTHLSDLRVQPQVYESLNGLLARDQANVFEAFARELDERGLLSSSWQLRRFFAKSLEAQPIDFDDLTKTPIFADLANFRSGPQLAPLLIGPIANRSPDLIPEFIRNLPTQFRDNPQFSWEFHRNTADKLELRESTPQLVSFQGLYAEFVPPEDTSSLAGEVEFLLTTVKASGGLNGRYGVALEHLRKRLVQVNVDTRQELILDLCGSRNEGVRWCVVKYLSENSTMGVRDQSLSISVIRRLSTDENPWVLRELCDFVADSDINPSDVIKKEILLNLQSAIKRQSDRGVPDEAIFPSFLKLWHGWPTMLSLFRLERT